MSTTKHVVQLNGKKYDAVTGKQVTDVTTKASAKVAKQPTAGPRVMDGVVSKSRRAPSVASRAQPSKTLMRNVVKKPATIKKDVVRSTAITKVVAKPKTAPTSSAKYPEIIKIEHVMHAASVKRSGLISKFGKPVSSVKTEVLPVKAAPAPVAEHTSRTATEAAIPASATASMVAAGLAKATSHTQPKVHQPSAYHRAARRLHLSPRVLAVGGSSLITIALVGFVAYHKMPSVAMKVAAARAGFSASLPTYQPAGFSLNNPIDYNPGQISLQYKSNSDNRNFSVVQRASSWNSQALLDNVVAAKAKEFQTYQANGRTIYIYDGNNATWVDGGVWYQIEGNSNLSSDQLLKIANSL